MGYFADLHIHSRFSRATSKKLTVNNILQTAVTKGLDLVGSGDFTHPVWLQELKHTLIPAERGFFRLKDSFFDSPRMVLQTEVSNIYKRDGKGRRLHHIILCSDFESAEAINQSLSRYGKLASDGRPMLKLDSEEMLEQLQTCCPDSIIIPAHIWTPWYALFGSKSGFNSFDECYGNQRSKISCIESGLSSDLSLNKLCPELDQTTILSFSDAHSLDSIGRNFTIVEGQFTFSGLKTSLRNGLCTPVDLFPEEGKYYYDGHRQCSICLSPEESHKLGKICPVCRKPLTIGVLNRILELSSKERKRSNEGIHIIPLRELLSSLTGKGVTTKTVQRLYETLIFKFGNEINILLEIPIEELVFPELPHITSAISSVRSGNVKKTPGYDGIYGVISPLSHESTDSLTI
jgi:uncharacterized protein (TIGR00375 family)